MLLSYHCSSPEHIIHKCLLIKLERKHTVKWQGGDSVKEGILDPSSNGQHTKEPPDRGSQGIKPLQQTPF